MEKMKGMKKSGGFLKRAAGTSGAWGITTVLLLVIYSASYSIWFDETFTIGLIQHSYKELIYLTGRDVHPPLYYIFAERIYGKYPICSAAGSYHLSCAFIFWYSIRFFIDFYFLCEKQ